MRVILFSAIYGDYEATAKQVPVDLPCRAFMFTDRDDLATQAEGVGWCPIVTKAPYSHFTADPRNGDPDIVTPMLAHKFWKTHPAEAFWTAQNAYPSMGAAGLDRPVSIWVDGNMEIETTGGQPFVDRCLAALGDDDWSLMAHPHRACVYTEHDYTAAVCSGRYSVEAMKRQIELVRASGHPEGWGLFASGHMVRRHTTAVLRTCDAWWADNVAWSHQDQLSLPPLVRRATDELDLRWNANLPWGMWTLHPHGA